MSHRYDTAVAVKLPHRLIDPLRSDRHQWRKGEDTMIVICADDFKSTDIDGQKGWSLSLIEDEHGYLVVDRTKQKTKSVMDEVNETITAMNLRW